MIDDVVSDLGDAPNSQSEEVIFENITLRPKSLADYVGQVQAKKQLEVAMQAAKIRGSALDHVLLHGPPGLGKTTLANIIAEEMGLSIRITSGPALEKQGDLAALLTSLGNGDILFIDEIHRLKKNLEEILYSAMEDGVLDVIVGNGPTSRSIRIDLPSFTLVGATTLAHKIAAPLRDRFGLILALDYYTLSDLQSIVTRSSKILAVTLNTEAVDLIAHCCRKTPRIANRILKQVSDFALVHKVDTVDISVVNQVLRMAEIDERGLQKMDRRYLQALCQQFSGGPVGLQTLAASLDVDSMMLAEVIEPYLLKIGFLQRTNRGRIVTSSGRDYILS
jgi:Holliday junction DNA helicase RuvB